MLRHLIQSLEVNIVKSQHLWIKKVKILAKSQKYNLKELLSMLKYIKTRILKGVYYLDSWAFGIEAQLMKPCLGLIFHFANWTNLFFHCPYRESLSTAPPCVKNLKLTIINEAEETFQSNIEDKTETFYPF